MLHGGPKGNASDGVSCLPIDIDPLELLRIPSEAANPRLPRDNKMIMEKPKPLLDQYDKGMVIGRQQERLDRREGQIDIPLDVAQEILMWFLYGICPATANNAEEVDSSPERISQAHN